MSDEIDNKINISIKARPRGAKLKVYDHNITETDIQRGYADFEIYGEVNDQLVTTPMIIRVNVSNIPPPPPPPTCPSGQCKDPITKLCRNLQINEFIDQVTGECRPIPDTNIRPLTFVSAGDSRAEAKFDKILGQIKSENIDWFFFLGDSQYRPKDTGKDWCDLIDKYGFKKKISILKGNHEDKEEDATKIGDYVENWFKDTYDLRSNDWYSSGFIGNVFYINMNTQDLDIHHPRTQFNKVKSDLQRADQLRNNGTIDWIFINLHKPYYTLKSVNQIIAGVREQYQPLFDTYQVDLVQAGHNHDSQFWLPISYNATPKYQLIQGTNIYDFSKPHGQYGMINGLLGRGITPFQDDEFTNSSRTELINKNVEWWNEKEYGYTLQKVYPRGYNNNPYTELVMQFKNEDKKVLKEVVIRK